MERWRVAYNGDLAWAAMRLSVGRAVGPGQAAIGEMIGELYREAAVHVGSAEEYEKRYEASETDR